MVLRESFMLRTAYPEIYEELQQNKRFFRLQIHLFTVALAVGILNDTKSEEKLHHDIIRLRQLEGNLEIYRNLIDVLGEVICINGDERACGEKILAYADGGLKTLWDEYQAQGVLDFPRIFDEAKKKWQGRIPQMLANIKQGYTYEQS